MASEGLWGDFDKAVAPAASASSKAPARGVWDDFDHPPPAPPPEPSLTDRLLGQVHHLSDALHGVDLKAALGATGEQDYGKGAGSLIDNFLTRGIAQVGNTGATATNELIDRLLVQPADAANHLLGGQSDLSGSFKRTMIEPLLEQAPQLQTPKTAGFGATAGQALTNLGGSIAMALATGGADVAAPAAIKTVEPSLAGMIREAVTGSQMRTAGILGSQGAGAQAAQSEANGVPVSNAALAEQAAAHTAANLLPMGHGLPLVARPVVGALSGVAGQALGDQASNQPADLSHYVTSAGIAALLSMIPGGAHGGMSADLEATLRRKYGSEAVDAAKAAMSQPAPDAPRAAPSSIPDAEFTKALPEPVVAVDRSGNARTTADQHAAVQPKAPVDNLAAALGLTPGTLAAQAKDARTARPGAPIPPKGLPAPSIAVDRAGTAMTSADFLAKAKQAQESSQQRTDLGITPDIERTQGTRWAKQDQQVREAEQRRQALAEIDQQQTALEAANKPSTGMKARPDESTDDALTFLAKKGGLARADFVRQGVNLDETRMPENRRRGGVSRPLFRASDGGGLSLDKAAEALQQHGYLPEQDNNAALDLIQNGLRGKPTYSIHRAQQDDLLSLEQQRRDVEAQPVDDYADVPFSRKPAPLESPAFSFAGERARTADRSSLERAQQMESMGRDAVPDRNGNQPGSPEDTHMATGWHRGVDGKWRFEIDDSQAKVNTRRLIAGRTAPLGDVLDHPQLMDAYPELANVPVRVDPTMTGYGAYSPADNSITIRAPDRYEAEHDAAKSWTEASTGTGDRTLKSVLLHEIQHAIQNHEGFARGGSAKEFMQPRLAERDQINARVDRVNVQMSKASREGDTAQYEQLMGERRDLVRQLHEKGLADDSRIQDSAHRDYRRLAGETEARNTQARMGMSADDRRATPPTETADVSRSEQIVRLNSEPGERRSGAHHDAAATERASEGLSKYIGKRVELVPATDLPDPVRRALEEFDRVFGGRTVVVENRTPEALRFEGFNPGKGYRFVDADARAPLLAVTAHEMLHSMEQERPDLYHELAAEVDRQGRLAAYGAELRERAKASGEHPGSISEETVRSELVGDAVGDAMADPAFLEGLAKRNPSLFRRAAEYIIDSLRRVISKLRTLGSNVYLDDVEAFRKKLEDVLERYAQHQQGEQRQEGSSADKADQSPPPKFSRKPADEEMQPGPPTGVKNEQVDSERAARGLDALEAEGKRTFGDVWDTARRKLSDNPHHGQVLAEQIAKHPRALNAEETAVLSQDRARIAVQRSTAAREAIEARSAGDEAGEAIAGEKLRLADEQMAVNDRAARSSGYEQGLGLAMRKAMAELDYSLGAMQQRLEASKGTPLTPEEHARLQKLHDAMGANAEALAAAEQKAKAPKAARDDKLTEGEARARLKQAKRDLKDADATRNAVRQKQLRKDIVELELRMAKGEFEKGKRQPYAYNEATQKLLADRNFLRRKFDRMAAQADYQTSSKPHKLVSTLLNFRRAILLSSIKTLLKLTAAASYRVALGPIEHGVQGALGKLPGLRGIAAKAPTEGRFSARAEGHALKQTFSRDTLRDMEAKLLHGEAMNDLLYGKFHASLHPWLELVGNVHAALKTPAERNAFARAQAMGAEHETQRALASGMSPAEVAEHMVKPTTQALIGARAFEDSQRAVLKNKNFINSAYSMLHHALENAGVEGGAERVTGKTAARTLDYMFPIVKVATNFALESTSYAIGASKAAVQLIAAKGVKSLTPDQADYIMRNLGKQTIGAALMAIGWYNTQSVGSFYQAGDNKHYGRPEEGSAFGIPKWALDTPAGMLLTIGANTHRIYRGMHKANGGLRKGTGGTGNAVLADMRGIAGEVPFFDEPGQVARLFTSTDSLGKGLGKELSSAVIPPDVRRTATMLDDPKKRRDPQNFLDELKVAIPGLRKQVPVKHERF